MRYVWLFLLLPLSLYVPQILAAEQAVERFALVVGNQNYERSPLRNTLNDTDSISEALSDLGFQVTVLKDVNADALTQNITRFYDQVSNDNSPNKLAVVYYSRAME
jgi:uncharacterized caspase-like protein